MLVEISHDFRCVKHFAGRRTAVHPGFRTTGARTFGCSHNKIIHFYFFIPIKKSLKLSASLKRILITFFF